jgi:adenylate kinase family enzyme
MVYDFVVLMGPPGAGKSYLGCLLRDQLGMIYTPLEPELRSRFGSGAEFLSRKVEALAFIEATLTQQQAAVDRPVVVESTVSVSARCSKGWLPTIVSCSFR